MTLDSLLNNVNTIALKMPIASTLLGMARKVEKTLAFSTLIATNLIQQLAPTATRVAKTATFMTALKVVFASAL